MEENTAIRRLCPDCGVELTLTNPDFGLISHTDFIFPDTIRLDIYTCPRCGLVRVYSPDQRVALEREERAKARAEEAQKREAAAQSSPAGDPWDKDKKGGLFGRFKDKD